MRTSLVAATAACLGLSSFLAACGNGATPDAAPAKDSATVAAPSAAVVSTTTPAAPASVAVAVPAEAPAVAAAPSSSSPQASASAAPPTKPGASDAHGKPATSTAPAASASPEAPKGPAAGKPWQVVASADADPGYHCNSDYPNKFTTTGGTNVTYPDPKPRGACSGNRVVVNVPIVPTAAGPGTVVGTLSYGICDDSKTSCLMKKKDVTLSFVASP